MKPHEQALRTRQDQGAHWWELRSCDYYDRFEQPKIMYQVIAFHSRFALDALSHFSNDKTFFLSSSDLYLMSVLNSSLLWWLMYRDFPHMKDEAIAMQGFEVEALPVPELDDAHPRADRPKHRGPHRTDPAHSGGAHCLLRGSGSTDRALQEK
jgi:hypothetical protein